MVQILIGYRSTLGFLKGPFFIFINDIVQDIDGQIKLFADDTSLYLVVDDPIENAETLNGDLNNFSLYSILF
jgi:hypothetical protein